MVKIFNFYIFVRQENAGRKWYQGVIHNCDDSDSDEILWGIKYVYTLYLQYLYFKCILNFFTFLTFIYVAIRFKLVLGHLSGKIKKLYMSGKTC